MNNIILIIQTYKIVKKDETRVIKKTIRECKAIYNSWSVLSPSTKEKITNTLNEEIKAKLNKCFDYYAKNYNVKIEKGYGIKNDIEINISNICESIKSWEE